MIPLHAQWNAGLPQGSDIVVVVKVQDAILLLETHNTLVLLEALEVPQ